MKIFLCLLVFFTPQRFVGAREKKKKLLKFNSIPSFFAEVAEVVGG